VRLLERRGDGLVSFEFSIGWPELAVELMLPAAAFDEFCARHQVIWRED
jgi:phenol hydroxylase P0 protein